ncbi:glycosyl transferase family protein [Sphingobium sufflavum]|uniref:glycosyl transferase family protein n=1 Tax=Sphingobium sufflavum TaxID=1129547 RepID=UPI001F160899|nr:glycosyl transferase family protein [Sphingobium sufflavum]MCE7795122.1 glycosyl transferase family protein [Sphingobium sufflavum]
MTVADSIVALVAGTRDELLLFAAFGLLLGGLDDLVLDLIFGTRRLWRAATVYRRFPRMTADRLLPGRDSGTMAVFIPAWDEGAVIGPMLRHCLARWSRDDVHYFVGVYPNDAATIVAVASIAAQSDHVTMVINPLPGPTTKADCLNGLWSALLRWEGERSQSAKAIVLHDAEDVVHGDAMHVMAAMIERFALVQLPVLPLVSSRSRWISGHYCDEFAESHAKALMVREALGAAMPSAGVGCAIARGMMGVLASARNGRPFDPDSLTEDYELGLRIGDLGGRGILLRMRDARGELVATREYFPDTMEGAVKQKARWMMGIALAGWDRLGWGNGFVEAWMRLHDRRSLLAALILVAAYGGLLVSVCVLIAGLLGLGSVEPLPPFLQLLLAINAGFLVWRIAVRMLFVHRAYGWAEALRSPLRMLLANIIAMMAARRAIILYVRLWAGGTLHWDKTVHRFPELSPALGTEGAA